MDKFMTRIFEFFDTEVPKEISEKYGFSPEESLELFLHSEIHRMIENPDLEMWEFAPGAIFDMWEAEKITGDPRNSVYLREP